VSAGIDKIYEQKAEIIRTETSIYKLTVKESQERVAKLETIISTPLKWSKDIVYRKIPNMALKAGGEEVNDYSLGKCRIKCTQSKFCKSISFRKRTGTCYISSQTMNYDDQFNTYLKKEAIKDLSGVGGEFILIPGIKLKPPDATVQGGSGANLFTLEECQSDCITSPQCKSISFSKSQGLCIRADSTLDYDGEWDYFEKDLSGVEKFDGRAYDIEVNDERKIKATRQLEVIRQQLRFTKEQDKLSASTPAYEKNRPLAFALAEERAEGAVSNAKVILPLP